MLDTQGFFPHSFDDQLHHTLHCPCVWDSMRHTGFAQARVWLWVWQWILLCWVCIFLQRSCHLPGMAFLCCHMKLGYFSCSQGCHCIHSCDAPLTTVSTLAFVLLTALLSAGLESILLLIAAIFLGINLGFLFATSWTSPSFLCCSARRNFSWQSL